MTTLTMPAYLHCGPDPKITNCLMSWLRKTTARLITGHSGMDMSVQCTMYTKPRL